MIVDAEWFSVQRSRIRSPRFCLKKKWQPVFALANFHATTFERNFAISVCTETEILAQMLKNLYAWKLLLICQCIVRWRSYVRVLISWSSYILLSAHPPLVNFWMFFQSPNDYLDSFRKKIYWWFQNSVLSEPNPFDHSIFVFLVDQIIPVLMELFPFFFRAKWSSFKGEIHLRKKSLFGIFVIPSFFFFFWFLQ